MDSKQICLEEKKMELEERENYHCISDEQGSYPLTLERVDTIRDTILPFF